MLKTISEVRETGWRQQFSVKIQRDSSVARASFDYAQDRLFRMTLRKSPVVILSPSPCVTLTLREPKGKGLAFWLRVNSAKNLNSL